MIDPDERYQRLLQDKNIEHEFVSVLETELSKLTTAPWTEFQRSAMIITSHRTVESLRYNHERYQWTISQWPAIWFVVGKKTSSALESYLQDFNASPVNIVGAESGNAETLVSVIQERAVDSEQLLFLAGDPHRPTLKEKIPQLETCITYQTVESNAFQRNLLAALDRYSTNIGLVVFSPRGIQLSLPVIVDWIASRNKAPFSFSRFVCIGETTASQVRESIRDLSALRDIPVIPAAQPTPESIIDLIT